MLSLLFIAGFSNLSSLGLGDFIKQVQDQNESYRAAQLSEEGANERKGESALVYWPRLEAETTYFHDELLSLSVPSTLKKQLAAAAEVKQQTPVGLSLSASTKFKQQDLSSFAASDYTQSSVGLGFHMSLWRNLLGSEVRSRYEELKNRNRSQAEVQKFARQAIYKLPAAIWV